MSKRKHRRSTLSHSKLPLYTSKSSLGFLLYKSSTDGQLRRRIKDKILWRQNTHGFEEAINLYKDIEKRRKIPVISARLETSCIPCITFWFLDKEIYMAFNTEQVREKINAFSFKIKDRLKLHNLWYILSASTFIF